MWADFGRRKPPPPLKRRYLHFIRWNTEIRSLTQALFYLSAAFCGIVSRYDSRIGRNELVQLFAVQCINSGLHAEVANIVTVNGDGHGLLTGKNSINARQIAADADILYAGNAAAARAAPAAISSLFATMMDTPSGCA